MNNLLAKVIYIAYKLFGENKNAVELYFKYKGFAPKQLSVVRSSGTVKWAKQSPLKRKGINSIYNFKS